MASKKPRERLFPDDHWNRPEPSTKGDATPADIYVCVGHALSAWETVEEALATLCMIFSGLREDADKNAAFRRLFGSIESSGNRRNAIKAAAEVYFWKRDDDDVMWDKLDDLLENVGKASRRRDDIAHGVVNEFRTGESSAGCFLLPSRYNSGRNKPFAHRSGVSSPETGFPFYILTGDYRYNSSDIISMISKFEHLLQAVMKHTGEAISWKEKVTSASTTSSS
jgi:hypothetical protein